jgi:hypothetical protein
VSHSRASNWPKRALVAKKLNLADIQRVELNISKALESAGSDVAPVASSTSCFGCFCTNGCISSFSCFGTVSASLADQDPEVVNALITLYRRGVAMLGEEGAVRALRSRIPQAITE